MWRALIATEFVTVAPARALAGRALCDAWLAHTGGTPQMNVNITRIVLPAYIAAFPLAPGKVYSLGLTEPQAQLDSPTITDPEPRGFLNSATEPDVA
jgi:hypothetical protein